MSFPGEHLPEANLVFVHRVIKGESGPVKVREAGHYEVEKGHW